MNRRVARRYRTPTSPSRTLRLVIAAAASAVAVLLAAVPGPAAGSSPPGAPTGAGLLPGSLAPLLVAELAARGGDEADASTAIRNYLDAARAHDSPAMAARAARIAVRAKRYDLGVEAAGLWYGLAPESRTARRMHALMLSRSDRLEEAVAALRDIAGHGGDSGHEGLDAVVVVLRQEPDVDRRIRLIETIADTRAESRYALARVLAGSKRTERAIGILRVLRRESPGEDRFAVTLALLLHGSGERDAALETLAARERRGDASDALLRTHARLLEAAGHVEGASERYAALLERRPKDLAARWDLGRLLTRMERYDDARGHFAQLYRWPAWRDGAWYFTGLIDQSLEDFDRAQRAYRKVRGGRYYVSARIRMAEIMTDTGQLRWARRHLAATPRYVESDDVRLYRAESAVLLRVDRPLDAMSVLDDALEAYPEHADLLYARAMVAEQVDRLDILEQDLRSIIAREPDHAEALNALGYTLADRTDRLQEALELVERALALEPDQFHIIDSMGWVLYRLGRHAEAVEYLRRSYELDQDPVVAAHLGEVLWVLGHPDEAREIWDAALEDAPDNEVLLETMERLGP